MTKQAEMVKQGVNETLHKALGAEPCETACTHLVVGQWTALGIANVIARAEEQARRWQASGEVTDHAE